MKTSGFLFSLLNEFYLHGLVKVKKIIYCVLEHIHVLEVTGDYVLLESRVAAV